jgi:hypothetical protein
MQSWMLARRTAIAAMHIADYMKRQHGAGKAFEHLLAAQRARGRIRWPRLVGWRTPLARRVRRDCEALLRSRPRRVYRSRRARESGPGRKRLTRGTGRPCANLLTTSRFVLRRILRYGVIK